MNALKNKKVIIALAAALVVVVGIGGWLYMDANTKSAANAEIDAAAVATYEKYRAIEEDMRPVVDTDEREVLVEKLNGLASLEATVAGDVESFRMSNGDLYKFDELTEDIENGISDIKVHLLEGYHTTRDEAKIDLEGTEDIDAINAVIEKLNSLKALVESEVEFGLFETEEAYKEFIESLNVDAHNARIETLNAAKAEAEAAAAANRGGSGSSGSGGSGGRPGMPSNRPSATGHWRWVDDAYGSRWIWYDPVLDTPAYTQGPDGIWR